MKVCAVMTEYSMLCTLRFLFNYISFNIFYSITTLGEVCTGLKFDYTPLPYFSFEAAVHVTESNSTNTSGYSVDTKT